MNPRTQFLIGSFLSLLAATCLRAQADPPNTGPSVTKTDIDIAERAARILDSPAKWNRADDRMCPPDAKTFSLYCALEKAVEDTGGYFEPRAAVMEEARSVIEEIAPDVHHYSHWLRDYNNDLNTSFSDIQGVLWLVEKRIAVRLGALQPSATAAPVTQADLQVVRRVRELLSSPEKWNRGKTECLANANTYNLVCAFEKAEKEITGSSEDGEVIREARSMISEHDAGHKYNARLIDYNADTDVSFTDLQTFLGELQNRLAVRLAER